MSLPRFFCSLTFFSTGFFLLPASSPLSSYISKCSSLVDLSIFFFIIDSLLTTYFSVVDLPFAGYFAFGC